MSENNTEQKEGDNNQINQQIIDYINQNNVAELDFILL